MMFGPPSYRINKGTCLKWIEMMENTNWCFDPAQLSFIIGAQIYGSPEGILASLAEPEPKLAWDRVSHLYGDSQFKLTLDLCKRLKVKGSLPEFTSFEAAISDATLMLASFILE